MNWAMITVLVSVSICINGMLLWSVKWLLTRQQDKISRDFSEVTARIERNKDRNAKIREEMSVLRECLPRDYVRREDWIMSFSRIEQKIDSIWQYIHDTVKGK